MSDFFYGAIAGAVFMWVAMRAVLAARRADELAVQTRRHASILTTYGNQLGAIQKQLGSVDYHAMSQSFDRWKARTNVFTEEDRRRMDAASKDGAQ